MNIHPGQAVFPVASYCAEKFPAVSLIKAYMIGNQIHRRNPLCSQILYFHTEKPSSYTLFAIRFFREYGADDSLRRADLRAYKAGSEVIDVIYKQGLIDELLEKYYPNATEEELDYIAEEAGYFHSIMLRENGILNLNFYGAYEDCFYITFAVSETGSEIIDCGRGFYLPAAVPAIATYPGEEEAE